MPITARFGFLREGTVYELAIYVKNEDIMASRISIKPANTKYIKVFTKEKGLLSMGL